MIKVVIFSYAGDALEVVECVRGARLALPEAVVTVVDDAHHALPEASKRALVAYGARYRQSVWRRNGNLRGGDCIRGMLSEMSIGLADDDVVVKLDSDTVLLGADWVRDVPVLRGAGYVAPCHSSGRALYGCCYALSGRAEKAAQRALSGAEIADLAPEDLTIYSTVVDLFGRDCVQLDEPWTPQNRTGRWSWWNWDSLTANPEDYARSYDVVSVGNPLPPHLPKSARCKVMRALIQARQDPAF